ncbi:MAG: alpha/beta hydrolase [Polyangiales bacterium]
MKASAIVAGLLLALYVAAVIWMGQVFPPASPRPLEPSDKVAEVLGQKLVYREVPGQGPTLVLLHGFGGNLYEWEQLSKQLDCGRVLYVDLLGFGASSRPDVKYELETHRRHLVGLLDALHIDEAVLVGHSFGASLTLWTAGRTPERITAAVAMAPSGMPGQLQAPWPKSFLYHPGLPNDLGSFIAHGALFNLLFEHSMARQALGISGSYDERFPTAVGQIKQPTLLLWSPGDVTAPFSYSQQFLARIPHAKLIRFDARAGHDPAGAQPELAVGSVCDFVRALPASAR